MFHYSSIFVVLVYVLSAQFFQRLHSWLLYFSMIVVSFFLSFAHIGKFVLASMPGHFNAYADNQGFSVSILKLVIVNLFFLYFLLQKDHFIKTTLDKYLFNSIFVGLLIFNIFSDFTFVSRLAQYFLAAQIVLVPLYLYSIKDVFSRKILLLIFLIYYLFDFNYALYRDRQGQGAVILKSSNALIPYENYFLEEQKSDRNLNIEAWYNYVSESTEREEESMK